MFPSLRSKLISKTNTRCWMAIVIAVVGSIVSYFLLVATSSSSNIKSPDVLEVVLKNASHVDNNTSPENGEEIEDEQQQQQHKMDNNTPFPNSLQIVYFGNSILYVNDCPTVLQNMIQAAASATAATTSNESEYNNNDIVNLQQEQCLIGGATLTSLWEDRTCKVLVDYVDGEDTTEDGDDIATFKNGIQHNWDYIIMNDQTQSPAREYSREFSTYSIRTRYVPLLLLNKDYINKPTIPIIIQTAAYRIENIQYSTDLGSFDEFTNS
jgi:hypothetical protein